MPHKSDYAKTKPAQASLPSERKGAPSPSKAGEILRHGEVHGEPLTKRQKGFFGAVRGKRGG